MTVWRRWRCRNVSVGSPSVDPQKSPGGLDVSGVSLFPHHLRRVQGTKVRTAARSPGILRRRRHLLLPGRGIGSLPRRCIDVGISFTIPIPEESLEMHDHPESGLRRECGESEPQCERHAVEPFPLRVGRQGTVRGLQRRSVELQATSMASTTKPGPKARATQGSAAPAFRSRSRMKSTVGDDMFPWLRSTSRDTSK